MSRCCMDCMDSGMDLFPNHHFLCYFLSSTALVGQSGWETVSAIARGDHPCFLCMCELDTPGGRTWNLSPSTPGSQVLLMLLPLVQALVKQNLTAASQLCVWRCCIVVGTGWEAKRAWAASMSSPVMSKCQLRTHAHTN